MTKEKTSQPFITSKRNGIIWLIFALIFLTGCASKVSTTPYSYSEAIALENASLPDDRARVFFANGVTTGPTIKIRHGYPAALLVNGNNVVQVNKSDVAVLEVHPGRYQFAWKLASNDSKSASISIEAVGGSEIILLGDYNVGGTGFGLLGAVVAPPSLEIRKTANREEIENLVYVKAESCPTSICVNH